MSPTDSRSHTAYRGALDAAQDETRPDTPTPALVRRYGHVPALDGLRGVAILLVLVYHFFTLQPSTRIQLLAVHIASAGWIGVDLFFALSGFLITGILYDAKGDQHYFRNFYVRRCLRIFPLYYGILALYILIIPNIPAVSGSGYQKLVDEQAFFWTYLSNVLIATHGYEYLPRGWTHFWSLAVEEQFYLVWPAIVFLSGRRRLVTVCTASIMIAAALRIVLALAEVASPVNVVLMFTRMDSLAAGALVALALRGPASVDWIVRVARWTLFAACVILGTIFASRYNIDPQTPLINLVSFPALACGFAALVALAVTDPRSLIARFFSHPALRWWGTYSYGLYVVHRPVGYQLEHWGFGPELFPLWLGSTIPRAALVMVVEIAASLVIAVASWHLYEKQFLKLKDRFPYGVRDRRGDQAPAVG